MQTQCPHCDTRFRVTESQVDIADGFVRCSVCKEVFNAFKVAKQHNHQSALDSQRHFDDKASESNTKNSENNSEKEIFDFFDEEANESLSHVVPENFKAAHDTHTTIFASNLLWGVGILFLCSTLFIEYIWFNRNQFNQNSTLQVWAEKICQQFECKNIAMRNPEKIELIARNVYSHPNEKDALMVNITIKNQANFAQPYPVMQVSFSDVRGGSVAARRFLPSEYLPAEHSPSGSLQENTQQLFEPDTNMTFTIEIQDPGKQAMAYEFDFL
ncbi:hypothetical protein MNBD_GAMMA06-97 [hydrothermal vent metagenome]|uniref:Zinc finger/thioredoxin putative domain-containing protein n=1 Tax=hydrothermal vent metagenome TaxID=652676 RepID=A0A3B0X3P4_9ZZZZ